MTFTSIAGQIQILTNLDEFNMVYSSNDPKLVFIDLRDTEDYENGHIDKFVNAPFTNENGENLLDFIEKNNYTEKTLVLLCYSSKRASKAFNLLYKNGYSKIYLVNIKIEELLTYYNKLIQKGPCNCIK